VCWKRQRISGVVGKERDIGFVGFLGNVEPKWCRKYRKWLCCEIFVTKSKLKASLAVWRNLLPYIFREGCSPSGRAAPAHFYDLPSTSLRSLTLSAKTVAFVEFTYQAFCSYAVAFFFWKATNFFSCDFFDQRKTTFFSLSFLVENKLLWRLDKGNGQARKTCNSLTWSKLHFRGCNAPFQARGLKSFLTSAVFQSADRAELNGRGPVAIFTLGPLWRISWRDRL